MGFDKRLLKEKGAILRKWFDHVLGTYPPETARFMKREPNQFANPVGHTIHHGLEGVVEEFLQGMDIEKLSSSLDEVVRIRAVQSFSPSQAIAFIFHLKKIVRETLQDEIRGSQVSPSELEVFDSRVDEIALLAFNLYVGCRETLYENRVNEVKNRTFRLLQRANLVAEIPDLESDAKDKTV